MSKPMRQRSVIRRSGEKYAFAVPLDGSKKVAYCTSNEVEARVYAARGGRYGGNNKPGAFGHGTTCALAKQNAIKALKAGKTQGSRTAPSRPASAKRAPKQKKCTCKCTSCKCA